MTSSTSKELFDLYFGEQHLLVRKSVLDLHKPYIVRSGATDADPLKHLLGPLFQPLMVLLLS